MSVLAKAGRIQVAGEEPIQVGDPRRGEVRIMVYGFPYRLPAEPPDITRERGTYYVALVHLMLWQGQAPFPGAEGTESSELLDRLSDFDLIVVGHNHQSFVEQEGR